MTDALRLEVKKDGWQQLQSGSYKLTVTLNPTDLDDNTEKLLLDFVKAPMGSRYMIGMARIGDDEQPVPAPQPPAGEQAAPKPRRPFHDLPASQQAALACKDVAFRQYIGVNTEDEAALWIRSSAGLPSRSNLDTNERAAKWWKGSYTTFEQWAGRVPVPR